MSGAIHLQISTAAYKQRKMLFTGGKRQLTGEEQNTVTGGNTVYWREMLVNGSTTAAATVNCQTRGGINRQLAAEQFGNGINKNLEDQKRYKTFNVYLSSLVYITFGYPKVLFFITVKESV